MTTAVDTFSAVPDWLVQFLDGSPLGRWLFARPAFFEASYAAAKSLLMAGGTVIGTMLGTAVTGGHIGTPGDFTHFLFSGGGLWGALIGFIIGGGWARLRAKEAGNRAQVAASPLKGP